MTWNPDQFQRDIGELLKAFNSAFLSDAGEYLSDPKGDRIRSLKILSALDISSIQKQLDEIIYQLESELCNHCRECLIDQKYSEADMQYTLVNHFYSGCVRSKVIGEVNSTISQLNDLTVHARLHLAVLKKNSGLGGFLKGIVTGYANPIDGMSHALGNGSTQLEVGSSVQGFNAAAILVGQLIDAVSESLKSVVLQVWNAFGAELESRINNC